MPETVSIREYEKFSYSLVGQAGVARLRRATDSLEANVLDFYLDYAQARQYVGLVKAGSYEVQILPKVYDADSDNLGYLLALLHYTRKLDIHPSEVADLGRSSGSFLEVWIRHFALELNHLLRTQYRQRYVEVEERSGFLRGKLLVERELDGTAKFSARYAYRYELFTPDHLLNRTLKFCNWLLLTQARTARNRRTLRENDVLLSDVASMPVRIEEVERIQVDRLNRAYEPVLDLCKLLLRNSTVDLRAGRISQLAIVFNMVSLFEEFVAAFLRSNISQILLREGEGLHSLEVKQPIGCLFEEVEMTPDLILHGVSGSRILLDTKYKSFSPKDKPSAGDLYQMYAYGTGGEAPFSDIVLLYPSRASTPLTACYQQGDVRVHVRGLDVQAIYDPVSKCVRRLAVKEQLNEALSLSAARTVAV